MAVSLALPLLLVTGYKSILSYPSDYTKSKNNIQGISLDKDQAMAIGVRFTSAFNTLGTAEFIQNAGTLYADELFIHGHEFFVIFLYFYRSRTKNIAVYRLYIIDQLDLKQ